ncbi:MAG: protein-methionine-sulfoxide reductase heme-binding subunit MsrQ, partial [Pseudomonadota bacterium]
MCCILLLPLGITAWELFLNPDALGANPVESAIHETGIWGLRLLLITLAISPLRKIFHLHNLIKFRRMLGLLCFVYVCAHLSLYIVFEQYFSWGDIWRDIQKRPYITVGFAAFILLIPLALTSNNKLQAIMQNKWNLLHKLIYPIAILAIL